MQVYSQLHGFFFIFVSSDLPCSHFCIDNSTCGCFKGYQLQSDAVSCEGKQNIVVSEDRVMNKDGRCIAAVLQKQKKIQGSSAVFCFFYFLKETRKGSNLRLAIFVLIFSFFPPFFWHFDDTKALVTQACLQRAADVHY